MVVLWVVLAVALLAVLVTAASVLPRRRRARRSPTTPGPPGAPAGPAPPPRVAVRPAEVAGRFPLEETEGALVEEIEKSEPAIPVTAQPETAVCEEVGPPPELRERMGKTRGLLSGYVRALRSRGSVDEQSWEDLEEALLRADVGVATTSSLLDDLRGRVRKGELRGPDQVLQALREDLRSVLASAGTVGLGQGADGDAATSEEGAPDVWLFVGVNGVGKTTTIGKVARHQVASGQSVLLAAADTFRAAAAEQLTTWAQRAGVEIVRGAEGGDPSAVVYDAVRKAAARGADLVLADTAGRLHTKVNLIEELKKIRRVADRPPGKVTEVLLVLDATTGQNGLAQARQFTEAVGVTGVVLTKLDGTAKGGIVVAIQRELGLPVKLVGIGEGPDDLIPFRPDDFVDALFD